MDAHDVFAVDAVPGNGIRMLRWREVEVSVGLRKSAVFRRIGVGDVSATAPLGECVRQWARQEITGWVRERRYKVFARLRELFEREDIEFAHREVTVRIADQEAGKPPSEAQKEAAAAAARSDRCSVIASQSRRRALPAA